MKQMSDRVTLNGVGKGLKSSHSLGSSDLLGTVLFQIQIRAELSILPIFIPTQLYKEKRNGGELID